MPGALAGAPADDGAALRLTIAGEAGGTWRFVHRHHGWWPSDGSGLDPVAGVLLDQDVAWRLFTKTLTAADAKRPASLTGDTELAARVLRTVSILAE